jgi:hypothetical protein
MSSFGATTLYAKKLSPNDNSKNQIYLGGDFSSLNIIPNHGVYTDNNAFGSKRDRFKADVTFLWIDKNGKYDAPNTQLILYPKYPEVRMSGFLKGSSKRPSDLMQSRDEGRVLFLGITQNGEILGYVVGNDSSLRKELDENRNYNTNGVFIEIPINIDKGIDSKIILLDNLRKIYEKGWIDSGRLLPDCSRVPCNSSNCGGYTLEAELGITANGYSEPDYYGWEVKQHGVRNFSKAFSGSPITLMTPEPTAGYYREKGVESFIRTFGYADKKGRADRLNFGGIYKCDKPVPLTGLTLVINGYNKITGKIENSAGGISLITLNGEPAATWMFADLMTHWNRKHAKAVYVPSMRRLEPTIQYCYGNIIRLGEGTDFYKFLKAIAAGVVYYDPGIKLENISTQKPISKRRSQFRIKQTDISDLYQSFEICKL